ncbi:MAG: ABC transporter ATP-binding protein [Lachnospiraceae bacterium]|nr:ABC transporter ATP-binding protein [Lachnospiraceae bacterium]
MKSKIENPGNIFSYFRREKWILAVVSVSGIFYNAGMTAGPWFEGMLAQYLCDIILGKRAFEAMVRLAAAYVLIIFLVQTMRYLKRLYVRKFANHVNRDMKQILYGNLVHKEKRAFEAENTGAIMTKAISDVDTCVEGMRKFTTEIFDTGVVMAAYLIMLLIYDWRLTLLSMLFPPVAYVIAQKLKKTVTRSAAACKESAGRLNEKTLSRIANALTWRVYGQEAAQDREYEAALKDYEQKAIRVNIWETAMQPLYQIISMAGAVFILWFGVKNVLGDGWASWDIAAFTTFLSCFTKLAAKSSKAAKLFNAVQKAQVSWKRIKPYMKEAAKQQNFAQNTHQEHLKTSDLQSRPELMISNLSFQYPEGEQIFKEFSLIARAGEIIGVTGPVACGKSTLGKVFLCEYPYKGQIWLFGRELSEAAKGGRRDVGYMGHDPELLSGTIEENILLGDLGDISPCLKAVCMEKEVLEMPEGIHTAAGSGGIRLSGGQQARIALARTLFHKKPLLILDDPFSAVDWKTEKEIFENLRVWAKDSIVILFSHRLTLFPEFDQVLWMENGKVTVSEHKKLMTSCPDYAELYHTQTVEGAGELYEKQK